MSAYSTIKITRSRAKAIFLQAMVSDISDEILEMYLDKVLEPRLYNVRIVGDDQENDDVELNYVP